MNILRISLVLLLVLASTQLGKAGIYISSEKLEAKEDLKEFLGQLRFFRAYGPTDATLGGKPTKQREEFLAKVEALRKKGKLTSDEQADLGGYLLYLKQTSPRQPMFEEAVAALEAGYRSNPRHFALASNLGTAYHLTGRLDAAQRHLEAAIDLAGKEQQPLVRLHLRLVQQRLREPTGRGRQPDLDTLFGRPAQPFRFVDEKGEWNYGRLGPREVEKLPGQSPEQALRQLQMLLVWLPDDGRLMWQLGEWALVAGKKSIALELFNSAVDTFRLSHPSLKQHRLLLQEAFHWHTIGERLGDEGKREQWVIRTLGQGLAQALPGEGLAGSLAVFRECIVKPENPNLGALFDGPDNEPIGKPFVMQPWHWGLVVLGIILTLLMLVWQVQQFARPRRA